MEGKGHLKLIYRQKETAPTSYYLQEGHEGSLPNRVCINRLPFAEVRSGGYRMPVAQFKATFKVSEKSKYRNDTRTLHTNVYPVKTTAKGIIGTGDIRGTDDLLIFEDRDNWKTIVIHIFPGCKFKTSEVLSNF